MTMTMRKKVWRYAVLLIALLPGLLDMRLN